MPAKRRAISGSMRVLVVSSGPLLPATRFARARHWSVEQLGTVDSTVEGSVGQAVASVRPGCSPQATMGVSSRTVTAAPWWWLLGRWNSDQRTGG